MKRQIRRGVFETNSSSQHSLCIMKKDEHYTPDEIAKDFYLWDDKKTGEKDCEWHIWDHDMEFGRSPFRALGNFHDKWLYACASLVHEYNDENYKKLETLALKYVPGLKKIVIPMISDSIANKNHPENKDSDYAQEYGKTEDELIYGLGVSLVNPTKNFIELIKKYPNAVIHVINGVLKPSDVETLENNNLKMLILGYKHLRRGDDFYSEDHENIVVKQNWLYENLADIIEKFKVVSFDNLAIDQLNVRRLMSDDEWNEFYMGDDGTMTYYIDMVERKFARSSTAAFDKRYDLLDSADDMFQKIVSE